MKQLKKLLMIAVISGACYSVQAQPPAGAAAPGDGYGEKISAKGAISLNELGKNLKKDESFTGKIRGQVKEVCVKKGCWVTMELPDKTKMQVKFKDYAFFVPKAIVGKTVILEGEAKQKIVSVNELKHLAEDAKKPKEEVDAITRPEKQVEFVADGVLVIK